MLNEKIKAIAEEKKIPIRVIEKESDLPQGSICRWDKIKPNVYKVKAVADYLGVDINDLLSD